MKLPRTLIGGRIRSSTIALALSFFAVLTVWILVRPIPVEVTESVTTTVRTTKKVTENRPATEVEATPTPAPATPKPTPVPATATPTPDPAAPTPEPGPPTPEPGGVGGLLGAPTPTPTPPPVTPPFEG